MMKLEDWYIPYSFRDVQGNPIYIYSFRDVLGLLLALAENTHCIAFWKRARALQNLAVLESGSLDPALNVAVNVSMVVL